MSKELSFPDSILKILNSDTDDLIKLAEMSDLSLDTDFIGFDLSNENLSNQNLQGINLSHADLIGTDFRNADLSNANLSHANLREANLTSANLSNSILLEASLFDAELNETNLSGANLSGAKILPIQLRASVLSDKTKLDFPLENSISRESLTNVKVGKSVGDRESVSESIRGTVISKPSIPSKELYAALDKVSHLLTKNSKKEDFHRELERLKTHKDIRQETLRVAEYFRKYTEIIDSYYVRFNPFGTQNLQNDIEDFNDVIGHSVVVGSYYLIDKWAVEYPSHDPNVLAEMPQSYLRIFERVAGHGWGEIRHAYGWPESARSYWKYLILQWKKWV